MILKFITSFNLSNELDIVIMEDTTKMQILSQLLIAEATECKFKSELEIKRPKSWLKTVSAFANGFCGNLLFGVDDDGIFVGIDSAKRVAEQSSNLIKERISPLPEFNLEVYRTNDSKTALVLHVPRGEITPYYYVADGSVMAYVRVGNESTPASPQRRNELVRQGKNLTFDALPTEYKVSDLTFTRLNAASKREKKLLLTENDYISFGLCKPDGTTTYAGLMFSDECPLLQSRVFIRIGTGAIKAVD